MSSRRLWLVGLLVLLAAGAHYVGDPYGLSLALWFVLAVAIGVILPRWWILGLAVIPWLLGVGVGLATGRYLYLGDGWQAAAIISVVVGMAGMGVGVMARQLAVGTTI